VHFHEFYIVGSSLKNEILSDLEEGLHSYQTAPIDYVGLQELHLHQVHSLLEIAFWPGIDGR
jgi:hypothetical protein